MTPKKAIVAGGTGLVGREIIKALVAAPEIATVLSLGRRTPAFEHTKIKAAITDFETFPEIDEAYQLGFCALGTTIKKAGSKEAFRHIDLTYALSFAAFCLQHQVKTFLVVSAWGASTASPIYYNRIKGELEQGLEHMGFRRLCIYRPSLLIGDREESRPLETAGKWLYQLIGKGPWQGWLGTEASGLAQAMVRESLVSKRSEKLTIFLPNAIAKAYST